MRKVIKNWEEIIEKHRQSGKSIEVFCNDIGIHPNTFYKNRQKLRNTGENKNESAVVEIKPVIATLGVPIILQTEKFTIKIPTGFDEAQLKSVLKVIGEL